MYNRLSIKNDINKIPCNTSGDYSITIDSVFFYEGVKKITKGAERIISKLVDYEGNEIEGIIWASNYQISKIFDYEDKFVARIQGFKNECFLQALFVGNCKTFLYKVAK